MSGAIGYYCSCVIIVALAAQSNAQGLITDVEGPDGTGTTRSSSPKSLSAGMIVLCTIVGVVVLIGITSTVLFIIAKRRQWAMREAITRSARRATQAIKTPLSARFPRSQLPQGGMSSGDNSTRRVEGRSHRQKANPKHNDIEKNSLITENERARNGVKSRTWGSLFSFGRS
ncbi:hypothetical protein ETB97_010745 [Aspergillus alliaceus]|uniref:Uncharacterized protein n=1 Tax=Petromyces alliaceus TaxID=209559 RepID=A0A5N6FF92_PETAA|nr:uncharacterized protein BDW43DRAFT_293866 [Aspergillus alliaceus]KAB8227510.1 hypothetical protein BDW43DRAFT_293866 [Aspergillus alliaceus]KAF5866651.1 hypothetical protein ETB97_010745 [Aspergillus burnettii]